jgi:hydroxymethylglutaryl-CoA lyase
MNDSAVTLVETPRDAFQGLPKVIPLAEKIRYIELLLDAGIKHIDLGSFVSPKAVPQMADSAEVFAAFSSRPGLERIAIVANEVGAQRALATPGLDTLGFPFSLSEEFQLANTRKTRAQTWPVVKAIMAEAAVRKKSFVLYLSMAFGNLNGEPWSREQLALFVSELIAAGVRHISFADTVGVANPHQVQQAFSSAVKAHPNVLFSIHLHGRANDWMHCIDAALEAGCRRFDCAAGGLGGCPFAHDKLIANIPSEKLAERLEARGCKTGVNLLKLEHCAAVARTLQNRYG